MATRTSAQDGGGRATLPDVVPFELSPLTRLSWELGARVVDGEASTSLGAWTRAGSAWSLSVFRIGSESVVVRVRTPVGRCQFYGATRSAVETVRSALEADGEWRPRA